MRKNSVKTGLRFLLRHKLPAVIGISGLAVGLAGCILVFAYVRFERSFDRFHADADNLYRIVMHQPGNSANGTEWWYVSPHIMAPTLTKDFPEVVAVSQLMRESAVVRWNGRTEVEDGFFYADASFFEIFNFPLLRGDPRTALAEPFSVLLTRRTAERYFGTADPIGKILTIGPNRDYRVTGVLSDIPDNSHLQFDLLASMSTIDAGRPDWKTEKTNWLNNNNFKTFVRLAPGTDPKMFDRKLGRYDLIGFAGRTYTFHVQPLTDVHFQGQYNAELGPNGDSRYPAIFSVVALFLLIIAGTNFVNLATSQAAARAKEVGVRKVVGAERTQLIGQFLGESLLGAFLALAAAMVMVAAFLPTFRNLLGSRLSARMLLDPAGILFALGFTALVGLAAGVYPAFVLSSLRPAWTLKGRAASSSGSGSGFRHVLVAVQFAISAVLIMGTFIARDQLEYLRNKRLGFEKDQIVTLRNPGDAGLGKNFGSMIGDLRRVPGVRSVSASTATPQSIGSSNLAEWAGKSPEDQVFFHRIEVDAEFIDLYGLEMVQGKPFAGNPTGDGPRAYILNETAAKRIGGGSVVGRPFGFWKIDGTVVGVVKDFHYAPLNKPIGSLGLRLAPRDRLYALSMKIGGGNIPAVLKAAKAAWEKYATLYPFAYRFLDESLDTVYKKEENLSKGFGIFSGIAVFVAAWGLFGLVSFAAERRRKEIGIRRVLGAGVPRIMRLLAGDFFKWILVADLLAVPVAYFVMRAWLGTFAYRTPVRISVFFVSTGLILLTSALTVAQRLFKAARENPAASLRWE